MISCLRGLCDLTPRCLETFWNGTRLAPIPFLISITWFLFLSNALRNGSIIACSSDAEMNEWSEYGTVP